jgi:hypothetical protein
MSYKTASQQRSTARSTKSSEASVAASPSGGYNLYNVTASTVINEITITPGQAQSSSAPLGITISSISVTNSSYTPLNPPTNTVNTAGGYISIFGNGFTPSSLTYIQGTLITATTFVSANQINAQVPALNVSQVTTQHIYIVNSSSNSAGILITGYQYGVAPYWIGGTISAPVSANVNFSLAALSDSTMTYAIISGSLPGGLTLNTSTGFITGSYLLVANSSTTITISATNLQNQYNTQTFNITLLATDPYFNYTTMLLNGEATTGTWLADASTNTFALTTSGYAVSSRNTPVQGFGYYSQFFDGSNSSRIDWDNRVWLSLGGGGVTVLNNYTIEFWLCPTAYGGSNGGNIYGMNVSGQTGSQYFYYSSTGKVGITSAGSGGFTSPAPVSSGTVALGVWSHVAIVISTTNPSSGVGTVTFYINGKYDSVTTGVTTAVNNPGSNAFSGTRGENSAYAYTGYISNFRISNAILYTSSFTPPTTPQPVSSTTFCLIYAGPILKDHGGYANTATTTLISVGNTTVSTNNPFAQFLSTTSNSVAVIGNNAPGYYGYSFDGYTGKITMPYSASLSPGTGDFTLECWFYALATSYGIMYCQTVSGTNWFVFAINSNYVNFTATSSGGGTSITSLNTCTAYTWNHAAVSRVSGVVTVYLNGVGGTPTSNTTNINVSYVPTMGQYTHAQSGVFQGYISNFRFINGTGVYTNNFTPTGPLTPLYNTVLLTAQSSNIIDNSTYSNVLTVTGTVKSVYNQPFPTVVTNATTIPATANYGSGYFDGSTGYITYTPSTSVSFGTNNFTVEMWVYPTSTPTTPIALDARTSGVTNTWAFGWGNGSASSGQLCWTGYTGSISIYDTTTSRITYNSWYHLAYCRSGTTGYLFVNGVQVATGTDNSNYNITSPTIHIGSQYSPNYYFPGYISNLKIVNGTALYTSNFVTPVIPLTATTGTQLLTLQNRLGQNNSIFYDDSPFNGTLTIHGLPAQGTFSPFSQTGWSYYLGGSGYYIVSNSTPITTTSTFTIEGWINMSATPGGSANPALIGDMNPTAGTCNWSFGPNNSNVLELYVVGGTSYTITGNTVMSLGTWYHVAVSVNSNSVSMYVNGIQQTLTGGSTIANRSSSVGYLTMGQWNSGSFNYAGYVSNLRISNVALYSSSFTPSTQPLTAISSTVFLTAQSNRFVDLSTNNYTLTPTGASVQAFSPFPPPAAYNPYTNGGSIYLNGSSYLTMPAASTYNLALYTNNFTVETWIYPTASGTIVLISNNYNYSGAVGAWAFYASAGTGVTLYFNHQGGNISSSATGNIPVGAWTHLAYSRNNGVGYFFINGTQLGTSVTDATNYGTGYLGGTMYIGVPSDQASYVNGYLSNLRVTVGAALYTGSFQLPTQNYTPGYYLSNNQTYNSYLFDGSTGYATIADYPNTRPGGSAWTVEFWFNPASLSGTQEVVSKSPGFQVYIYSSVITVALSSNNTLTYFANSSFGTPVVNAWNHVAIVFTGSAYYAYLNGIGTLIASSTTAVNTTGATWGFGGSTYGSFYGAAGYISNFRLVNGTAIYTSNFVPPVTPLTAVAGTSLLTLQNSTLIDNSINNYTITKAGTVTTSSLSPFSVLTSIASISSATVALSLLGTNAGIIDQSGRTNILSSGVAQVQSSVVKYGSSAIAFTNPTNGSYVYPSTNSALFSFGTGDFTIEAWLYPTSFSTTNGPMFIDFRPNGTNSTSYFAIGISTGGVLNYSSNNNTYITAGTALSLNTWTHVVVARSSSTVKMFLNGTQTGSSYTDTNSYIGGTNRPVIGANGFEQPSSGVDSFIGYMDDIRITKGYARYTTTFTVSTLPDIGQ